MQGIAPVLTFICLLMFMEPIRTTLNKCFFPLKFEIAENIRFHLKVVIYGAIPCLSVLFQYGRAG